jgi:hypothetical protein
MRLCDDALPASFRAASIIPAAAASEIPLRDHGFESSVLRDPAHQLGH